MDKWMSVLKPCLEAGCGELSDGPRCDEHRPSATALRVGSPYERGYDQRWRRLSERARRLQPWCSDCGTDDDLTSDHLPSAWARRAAGLPLRLRDVEVVCRDCNAARGSSRPGSDRATLDMIAGHVAIGERRTLGTRPDAAPIPTGTQGRIRHSPDYPHRPGRH